MSKPQEKQDEITPDQQFGIFPPQLYRMKLYDHQGEYQNRKDTQYLADTVLGYDLES
jgi:hypothetical protein